MAPRAYGARTVTSRLGFTRAVGNLITTLKMETKGFDSGVGAAIGKLGVLKSVGVAAGVAIGASLVQGLAEATQARLQFQYSMQETFNLLPGMSRSAMAEMYEGVREFARRSATSLQEAAEAAYQSISAGVDESRLTGFLKVSDDLAKAWRTDLPTAAASINTALNAYGYEANKAAEVTDKLFTIVQKGVLRGEDLSRTLSKVLPVAADMGVEIEEVGAALAALTRQGSNAAESATQIRQIMVQLSREGAKADKIFREIAGESFPQFIKNGGDLQGALNLIKEYTEDTGKTMFDVFGRVEAASAALTLTGKAGSANWEESMEAMATATGTVAEAAENMRETTVHQWRQLQSNIGDITDNVMPALSGIAGAMAGIANIALSPITWIVNVKYNDPGWTPGQNVSQDEAGNPIVGALGQRLEDAVGDGDLYLEDDRGVIRRSFNMSTEYSQGEYVDNPHFGKDPAEFPHLPLELLTLPKLKYGVGQPTHTFSFTGMFDGQRYTRENPYTYDVTPDVEPRLQYVPFGSQIASGQGFQPISPEQRQMGMDMISAIVRGEPWTDPQGRVFNRLNWGDVIERVGAVNYLDSSQGSYRATEPVYDTHGVLRNQSPSFDTYVDAVDDAGIFALTAEQLDATSATLDPNRHIPWSMPTQITATGGPRGDATQYAPSWIRSIQYDRPFSYNYGPFTDGGPLTDATDRSQLAPITSGSWGSVWRHKTTGEIQYFTASGVRHRAFSGDGSDQNIGEGALHVPLPETEDEDGGGGGDSGPTFAERKEAFLGGLPTLVRSAMRSWTGVDLLPENLQANKLALRQHLIKGPLVAAAAQVGIGKATLRGLVDEMVDLNIASLRQQDTYQSGLASYENPMKNFLARRVSNITGALDETHWNNMGQTVTTIQRHLVNDPEVRAQMALHGASIGETKGFISELVHSDRTAFRREAGLDAILFPETPDPSDPSDPEAPPVEHPMKTFLRGVVSRRTRSLEDSDWAPENIGATIRAVMGNLASDDAVIQEMEDQGITLKETKAFISELVHEQKDAHEKEQDFLAQLPSSIAAEQAKLEEAREAKLLEALRQDNVARQQTGLKRDAQESFFEWVLEDIAVRHPGALAPGGGQFDSWRDALGYGAGGLYLGEGGRRPMNFGLSQQMFPWLGAAPFMDSSGKGGLVDEFNAYLDQKILEDPTFAPSWWDPDGDESEEDSLTVQRKFGNLSGFGVGSGVLRLVDAVGSSVSEYRSTACDTTKAVRDLIQATEHQTEVIEENLKYVVDERSQKDIPPTQLDRAGRIPPNLARMAANA